MLTGEAGTGRKSDKRRVMGHACRQSPWVPPCQAHSHTHLTVFSCHTFTAGKAWSRKRLLEFLCEDSDLRPRASAVSFLLPALASTTDPPLNSNYQPWVVGEGCRRAGVCLELSYERLPGDVAALCGLRVELFLLHHRHVVSGPASVPTFPIFDHLLSAPSNVLDQLSLRPGTTFRYLQRRSGMFQPFSPSTYANSDGFCESAVSLPH